jgi:hypothetical protein
MLRSLTTLPDRQGADGMCPDIEDSLIELFSSANEFGRIRYAAAATSRISAGTDVDMA